MKTTGYMHSLDASGESSGTVPMPFAIGVFVVFAIIGGITAYFFTPNKNIAQTQSSSPVSVQTDTTAGIVDKATFKDTSTGVLREGGMEGEGNFHLERPGGVSQNVYLTSSTVDLGKFVGKKVTVWGQTFQGQKAGWLMDVGLVEIN